VLKLTSCSDLSQVLPMVLNYRTQLAASLFQAVLSLFQTTFLLKWAARSCAGTKYVFKIDDDVFVNSDKMWLLLGMDELWCHIFQINIDRGS
jgi:hypothetical protein